MAGNKNYIFFNRMEVCISTGYSNQLLEAAEKFISDDGFDLDNGDYDYKSLSRNDRLDFIREKLLKVEMETSKKDPEKYADTVMRESSYSDEKNNNYLKKIGNPYRINKRNISIYAVEGVINSSAIEENKPFADVQNEEILRLAKQRKQESLKIQEDVFFADKIQFCISDLNRLDYETFKSLLRSGAELMKKIKTPLESLDSQFFSLRREQQFTLMQKKLIEFEADISNTGPELYITRIRNIETTIPSPKDVNKFLERIDNPHRSGKTEKTKSISFLTKDKPVTPNNAIFDMDWNEDIISTSVTPERMSIDSPVLQRSNGGVSNLSGSVGSLSTFRNNNIDNSCEPASYKAESIGNNSNSSKSWQEELKKTVRYHDIDGEQSSFLMKLSQGSIHERW
jgi:hypothetical protein